jgi:checkpoint serine/threonine-protein kinase
MNHFIDMATYIEPPDAAAGNQLNESIMIDTNNPFDEHSIRTLLSRLERPIETFRNYYCVNTDLPKIAARGSIDLGGKVYNVLSKLGEGAYAKVYRVKSRDLTTDLSDSDNEQVVKVQQPACQWEFYITSELRRRLSALSSPVDVRSSVMFINEAYFFNNGSCFVYDYQRRGTILDLLNVLNRKSLALEEWFVIYLAIELLNILIEIHRCRVIHGDLKPDNILVRKFQYIVDGDDVKTALQRPTSCLKLIDFGQSIDMTLFPDGVTFTAKVTTSGFQCPEMKTNRPWTYQTDLFGLIGTIHVMLFSKYMAIRYVSNAWRIFSSFQRKWKACTMWKRMFDECLNIPSCTNLPDLVAYRQELSEIFTREVTANQFNSYICELEKVLGEC